MFHSPAGKIVLLAPKLAFIFVREAMSGLANAYDVVADQARIDLFGLESGASVDEMAVRRNMQAKEAVLKRATKIAGAPSHAEMSKDDLVREAMNYSQPEA